MNQNSLYNYVWQRNQNCMWCTLCSDGAMFTFMKVYERKVGSTARAVFASCSVCSARVEFSVTFDMEVDNRTVFRLLEHVKRERVMEELEAQ